MSRRRTKMVTVRMSEDEYAAIQRRAAQAGMSVGAYLRDRALAINAPRAVSMSSTYNAAGAPYVTDRLTVNWSAWSGAQ